MGDDGLECWQGCRVTLSLILFYFLWGRSDAAAPESAGQFPAMFNTHRPHVPAFLLLGTNPWGIKLSSRKILLMNVTIGFIGNSQKLKTAQILHNELL